MLPDPPAFSQAEPKQYASDAAELVSLKTNPRRCWMAYLTAEAVRLPSNLWDSFQDQASAIITSLKDQAVREAPPMQQLPMQQQQLHMQQQLPMQQSSMQQQLHHTPGLYQHDQAGSSYPPQIYYGGSYGYPGVMGQTSGWPQHPSVTSVITQSYDQQYGAIPTPTTSYGQMVGNLPPVTHVKVIKTTGTRPSSEEQSSQSRIHGRLLRSVCEGHGIKPLESSVTVVTSSATSPSALLNVDKTAS